MQAIGSPSYTWVTPDSRLQAELLPLSEQPSYTEADALINQYIFEQTLTGGASKKVLCKSASGLIINDLRKRPMLTWLHWKNEDYVSITDPDKWWLKQDRIYGGPASAKCWCIIRRNAKVICQWTGSLWRKRFVICWCLCKDTFPTTATPNLEYQWKRHGLGAAPCSTIWRIEK